MDGTIIDIITATGPPARTDPMHRFERGTCARLVYGASGVVRSDILVASSPAQHLTQTWQATVADNRWMDELFPLAQEAMRSGYYMPHRNWTGCSRHYCPYWQRCEQTSAA